MQDLITRLKERARIRRGIPTRKSGQAGEPDRIADLLEEAAQEILRLWTAEVHESRAILFSDWTYKSGVHNGLSQAIEVADKERLYMAVRYSQLTESNQARMTGNMEWAMLEGAVKVVQQLRSLQ